jgi:hypothetical protein
LKILLTSELTDISTDVETIARTGTPNSIFSEWIPQSSHSASGVGTRSGLLEADQKAHARIRSGVLGTGSLRNEQRK